MSGFFDLFKPSTPDASADKAAASSDASKTPETKNLSDSPATVDKDGKVPGTNAASGNPLDAYATLFQNAANAKPNEAPSFSLDPKVVSDVASKMDFVKGVNPELMQKATSGDVNALIAVMQSVGQQSYQAALQHNSALTETFVNQRSSFEQNNINQNVRQQLTQSQLADAPNYDHPVIKAELNRVANQFAKANPDLPPQEIAKAAQKYIGDLAQALAPKAAQSNGEVSGKPGDENFDWTTYLTKSS